ncbi:MAG: DUF3786 domain-containing protein [Candidatus Adiutrix sp.]|nr:DUF3786 domain-containing protein [Candidatus Adiutrix sp.]
MATEKDNPARPEEISRYSAVADVAPELWADVEALPPEQVAARAGAIWSPERGFTLPYMGGDYVVDMAGRDIIAPPGHQPAGFQKALALLCYLAQAQDLGQAGRMITARELNGGAMFFTGPHALLTEPVTAKFGRGPEAFLRRAASLGMAPAESASGFACQGNVLPNIAVGCVLHPEDDEFPAELTYTFDAYAHYHLALDGLWAVINVLAVELAA